jgi:hypothetical protein
MEEQMGILEKAENRFLTVTAEYGMINHWKY